MDRKSFEKYELSADKEKELWKDSIVIFDTSALIDFYYYPKETRQEIFEKIFLKLKDRLWIPYHVQFEYLKNRKGIIEKPIVENYNPLKNEKIKDIVTAKSQILKISEQIKKDTLKPEKHPFLPQEKIDEFIEFTKEIDARVQQFEKDLKEEITKQETEIKSLNQNDTILKAFEENLEVGPELSHSEIMRIVSEGKFRYEYQIPPGYKDLKDKIGTQIFGDLIVWKQILTHAKKTNKNVIFICNDLKIDWCYKDSRNRIESPREELIKEFNDNNQKDFWMYNQSQFVYKANEFLEVDIADAKIEEISNVISNRNNDALIYKCGYCHHINEVPMNELYLEFDCVGGSERSMGEENQYQSEEPLECSSCGIAVNVTLEIWEYPVGAHNTDDITIDNGEIIQSPDFVTHFWDMHFDEPDEDMFRER
tara:strand:- start:2092 stop:3360 length:1269 start_codon:yes stop_codon:yes gene_type:complete